jgi:hypothetical protein
MHLDCFVPRNDEGVAVASLAVAAPSPLIDEWRDGRRREWRPPPHPVIARSAATRQSRLVHGEAVAPP